MKKRLICLLAVLCMLIPAVLTGCGGGSETPAVKTSNMTLTLYGITGESTTPEAVKQVQEAINKYTEGQFGTHIELRLYTEEEYYDVLDEKLREQDAELERIKAEKKKNKNYKVPVEYIEGTAYPKETTGQVDIFMVQGASKLGYYYENSRLADLTDMLSTEKGGIAKLLNFYISKELFTTVTYGGKLGEGGLITNGKIYGIPNNNISGEYTYLLVNKELAGKYHYSAEDVNTLETLAYFLDDVKTNHPDYIPLYNRPELQAAYLTEEPSFIGAPVINTTAWYNSSRPRSFLNLINPMTYYDMLYKYKKAGYITEGDYYGGIPSDKNVAAAFLKGNAALPEEYEDKYYVINYQNPVASASERPGTVFCVNSETADVSRCMEVISALQTVSDFRNTFQYGVEDVHYTVDEFTGMINIVNNDYSMNPADTGNLFILKPNSSMDEATLKLAENNWALAKQQNQDTITGPYCKFDFDIVTKDNFEKTSAVYAADRDKAMKKQGSSFNEEEFAKNYNYKYMYTDVMLDELVKISEDIMARLETFEEYVDAEGKTVDIKTYIRQELRPLIENNEYYKAMTDASNPDSPVSQYNAWFEVATKK